MSKKESIITGLTILNTVLLLLILAAGGLTFILTKGFIVKSLLPKIVSSYHAEMLKSKFITQIGNVKSIFTTEGNEEKKQSKSFELPVYEMKIKPFDLRQIQLLVEKLIKKGGMTDEEKKWFPVKLYYEGEEYEGKVRLRGDNASHWKHAKKSWRIKLKRDKLLNGYRHLDFIIPGGRNNEIEKVAYDAARKLDLLVPDAGFARMRLNGIDMGLYFWIEKNSKEMLERLQYPEGEFFRENNTQIHTYVTKYGSPSFILYTGNYTSTIHKDPSLGYYAERWDNLITILREGTDKQFQKELPFLIDMEKYLKWNALTWIFNSVHSRWAVSGDNLRWYYDNTRGLFEPILNDIFVEPIEYKNGTFEASETDPLAKRIFRIPMYQHRRNEILWKIINDPQFDMVARSEELFQKIRPFLLRGVDAIPWQTDLAHRTTSETLKNNQTLLKGALGFTRVFVTPELILEDNIPGASIRFVPDSLAKVSLDKVVFKFNDPLNFNMDQTLFSLIDGNGKEVEINPVSQTINQKEFKVTFKNLHFWTYRDDNLSTKHREWIMRVDFRGIKLKDWIKPNFVSNISYGFSNSFSMEKVKDSFVFQSPLSFNFQKKLGQNLFASAEEIIKTSKLPFKQKNNELILDEGEYHVLQDLVIPVNYGLHLNAGVVLKMAPGVSIITYRALKIDGSKEKPVKVIPLNDHSWGSLAVINARARSKVNHLLMQGGSEDHINGIFVSGELCFYSSDVDLTNSEINNARGDDGLNIKKSNFLIKNSRFIGNISDAFDVDWAHGTIEKSFFLDNFGDGLDLSGSSVIARDSFFSGSKDKGISVGEKSEFFSFNNVIQNSTIGLASKDLSKAYVYATVFYNNQTAISLYNKKQIFGGAWAEATSALFWKNKINFYLDKESSLKLVGVGVEKWMPQEGIMAEDVRQGNISEFYKYDDSGNVFFRKPKGNNSPFKKGPFTQPKEIKGFKLPNFSEQPIGLFSKLEISK